MSCTNLVRSATQSRGGSTHARRIAHAAARSQLTPGAIPGPAFRTRKHRDDDTAEDDSTGFDPNKMTSTSVAHYYKSAEDFHRIRRNAHLHKGSATALPSFSPSYSASSDSVPRASRSTPRVPSETSPTGPRIAAAARTASELAWQRTFEKRKEREDTLKRFTYLIRHHFGDKYDARPFGSTCYGASSNASDIDVVIVDAERPYGIAPDDDTPLPEIYNVRRLAKLLRREGYKRVSCISNAAVPIVKFTDPFTGMSCDANVNNRLGVYNTALLRQYCLRMPVLASYLRHVKTWVRSVDLNNPSVNGKPTSFSSYSITLMTVAYLQSLGHLPNLQADKEVILDTQFWERRRGMHRLVPISFGACKDWVRPPWLRPPTFRGWLRFWAHEFDYETRVVSVRDGGFIDRPKDIPPEWGHRKAGLDGGHVVVLDPLSHKNCTWPINAATLERFKQECAAGLRRGL